MATGDDREVTRAMDEEQGMSASEAYQAAARYLTSVIARIDDLDPDRDETVQLLGDIASDLRDAA